MTAAPDTPEGDRLDLLATLVEAYESKHYPMDMPNPIEAIKFRMEQSDLRPVDVAPMFGKVNRYYEVMTGKRGLTLAMIRTLSVKLRIPAEVLIQPITLDTNPGAPKTAYRTIKAKKTAGKAMRGRRRSAQGTHRQHRASQTLPPH